MPANSEKTVSSNNYGRRPANEKLINRTVKNVNQLIQMYLDYDVNHLKPSTIDSYHIYAAYHVAPLVGHSVRGMTNRYSHTNSAFQIHAANIISTRICKLMNGEASLIGKELVWEPNAQGI